MNPVPISGQIDNLALIYQGLLTSIVRVRSGSQPINDCDDFRRRTRQVLAGIEREAIRVGYREEDVRNTNYAIVAFLDESVLDSNDPNRHSWSALQAEMYGDAVAGESFFVQLDALRNRRDSQQLADILEVYYLCLLLGYRGRYAGYARERASELGRYMDDLKIRIENVRGRDLPLWPGLAPALPRSAEPVPDDSDGRRLRFGVIASFSSLLILWFLCWAVLAWQASDVRSALAL